MGLGANLVIAGEVGWIDFLASLDFPMRSFVELRVELKRIDEFRKGGRDICRTNVVAAIMSLAQLCLSFFLYVISLCLVAGLNLYQFSCRQLTDRSPLCVNVNPKYIKYHTPHNTNPPQATFTSLKHHLSASANLVTSLNKVK